MLAGWTRRDGGTLLDGAIRAEFFRAPTDNDRGGFDGSYAVAWRRAGLDRLKATCLSTEFTPGGPGLTRVVTRQRYTADGVAFGFDVTTAFTLGEGGVGVDVSVIADGRLPPLPRVGVRLVLPDWPRVVRYLGRGPHENYADRKASAFLGDYSADLDDLSRPYVVPAEHGARTDVRRIVFTGEAGQRLTIDAETPLQFTAHRFTVEDLDAAGHTPDLPRRDCVYVHLDARHMGVGGDIGWGRSVREPYRVRPGAYRFGFRLS